MLKNALIKLKNINSKVSNKRNITEEIKENQAEMARIENNYDSETDIDMLDSYIYEILAKKSKIKYLKRIEKNNAGDDR